jgi:hypothetical protein
MRVSLADILEVSAIGLLLALPLVSLIGAWFLDRRLRGRGEPAFRRLFGLAAYCGGVLVAVVAVFAVVLAVPHDFTGRIRLLNLSYAAVVSAGYLSCVALCALLLLGLCGLIVKYRVHRRT